MTTPSSAKLLVFVSEKLACIRIVGRANFNSSIEFQTLVRELLKQQYECFLLDLTDCLLMDSTFLGVLADFGLRAGDRQDGQQNGHSIELLNPNPRISDLLENLGMAHLFDVINGAVDLPEGCSSHAIPAMPEPKRDEVKRTCLRAHETLMALSPANAAKFKDVATFLAEDLKKSKAG
jgi:anti-anti-sigma factor